MALPQVFGIIPTGLPPIITPTSVPTQTSFIYALPVGRTFSHIVVFLLPGVTLPPNTAAAVYISIPPSSPQPLAAPDFKFLGAIGPGKESAIFKISGQNFNNVNTKPDPTTTAEVDMDAPDDAATSAASTPSGTSQITLGISIESAEAVAAQMATLSSTTGATPSNTDPTTALVLAPRTASAAPSRPDTIVLAQRIIRNAFNFLASFSGNINGGVEVVPLKAFEEWWRKFEARVKNDPGFLEREGE